MTEQIQEAAEKYDKTEANKYKFSKSNARIVAFIAGAKWREGQDNWISVQEKGNPTKYGKYLVYREKCGKTHFETWNNTGWAYNNNDITHWQPLRNPPKEK